MRGWIKIYKIQQLFAHYSIKKKIGVVYSLYIVPVLLVLAISVILLLSKAIVKNIEISVTNNSGVIISQIEDKMQNAQNCANIMLGYLNELDFLREESKEEISSLKKHNLVLKMMTYAYRVFSDVDGMVFVDRKGNVYGDSIQMEDAYQKGWQKEGKIKEIATIMEGKGGKAEWFPITEAYSISKENRVTLTLAKNIVDISTGERLGVLYVTIEESSLSKVYDGYRLSENAYYVIMDQQGTVVSSPKKEELGEAYSIHSKAKYYSKGQYFYRKDFLEAPYALVFHAPLTDLMEDTIELCLFIILIGGICIFIAYFLASKLSGKIAEPIIDLSKAMDEVSRGDISVRFQIHTMDETKLIGDGFNHMLDTIEELLEHVKQEQKSKRKYELALIQSQIKPHFLYNTLDTIYVLSHMGRNDEAKKTVKALADFYRVSLSAGREMIPLASELKCTMDYLKIQALRYAEEFTYQMHVDVKWDQVMILKLSIQPLVENAIYHGLKEKEGHGFLQIYGEETEDELFICVKDNGCGIEEEKQKSLLLNDTKDSFGLKNLNDRIQMYFGAEYGLIIQSVVGEGTVIKIHIPIKGGE